MLLGSWLTEDPTIEKIAGERISSGFSTAVPCCVFLVKLLNFSGLTFPHIHSLVTSSLGGLSEGACHNS